MQVEYKTQSGEMWDQISKNCYGDEYHVSTLINANPYHAQTFTFTSAVTLNVPQISNRASYTFKTPWES